MINKIFNKNIFKKKSSNNSLKQSIETVLDSDLKDAEGISKHERLMLGHVGIYPRKRHALCHAVLGYARNQ